MSNAAPALADGANNVFYPQAARTTPLTRTSAIPASASSSSLSSFTNASTSQKVIMAGLATSAAAFAFLAFWQYYNHGWLYGSSSVLSRHLKRMGVQHMSIDGTARLASYDKPVPVSSILNTALASFVDQIEPGDQEPQQPQPATNAPVVPRGVSATKTAANTHTKHSHHEPRPPPDVDAGGSGEEAPPAEEAEELEDDDDDDDEDGENSGEDNASNKEGDNNNDEDEEDNEHFGYTPFVPPGGARPPQDFPEEAISCDVHKAKHDGSRKHTSGSKKKKKKRSQAAPAPKQTSKKRTSPKPKTTRGLAVAGSTTPSNAYEMGGPAKPAHDDDNNGEAAESNEEYVFDETSKPSVDVSYRPPPPPGSSI